MFMRGEESSGWGLAWLGFCCVVLCCGMLCFGCVMCVVVCVVLCDLMRCTVIGMEMEMESDGKGTGDWGLVKIVEVWRLSGLRRLGLCVCVCMCFG